jgi:hypothetical protein
MTPAVLAEHHRNPSGWLLAVLIVLVIVYFGWRRSRGRSSQSLSDRLTRLRAELSDLRIGPLTLLPLALLVIVVVILLVAH